MAAGTTLLTETQSRHADILDQLQRLSKRLSKRFTDELAKRATEATPAQIAGWQAMIWRYHAEIGMASIATPANLVKAASLLDELAARYPEADRFQLHFKFVIDKPNPDFGPAKLAFLSWHYQARFTDFYGRLLPTMNLKDFEETQKLFSHPHRTASFEKLAAEIE